MPCEGWLVFWLDLTLAVKTWLNLRSLSFEGYISILTAHTSRRHGERHHIGENEALGVWCVDLNVVVWQRNQRCYFHSGKRRGLSQQAASLNHRRVVPVVWGRGKVTGLKRMLAINNLQSWFHYLFSDAYSRLISLSIFRCLFKGGLHCFLMHFTSFWCVFKGDFAIYFLMLIQGWFHYLSPDTYSRLISLFSDAIQAILPKGNSRNTIILNVQQHLESL